MPNAVQDLTHVIQTSKNGRLDDDSGLAHVTDVVRRAAASGRPIALHLHGGLVKKSSAYETVNRLQPQYLQAGIFPIFIVWRTGLFDALKNLDEITKKPLFQKLLVRLLKFFVGKLALGGKGAAGPGDEPDDAEIEQELQKLAGGAVPYASVAGRPSSEDLAPSELIYLERQVQVDRELNAAFDTEIQLASQPTALAGPAGPKLDGDVVRESQREEEELGKGAFSGALVIHVVKIAARVARRFFHHTDHRLHATLVEEICRELFFDEVGTAVWGFMKQDAADTFAAPGESPERAGWLLLQLLDDAFRALQAKGSAVPPFSLVAHSAGSIYACHLLLYLDNAQCTPGHRLHGSPVRLNKLTFLAPACRHSLFAEVLQRHAAHALFDDFRMFGLTDDDELGYYELPAVYPGSLLYLVSGLFEDEAGTGETDQPLVGMQRYYRTKHPFSQPDVRLVADFLGAHPDRLVQSGEDRGDGLRCDSRRHGTFDDSDQTVASFLHFLRT